MSYHNIHFKDIREFSDPNYGLQNWSTHVNLHSDTPKSKSECNDMLRTWVENDELLKSSKHKIIMIDEMSFLTFCDTSRLKIKNFTADDESLRNRLLPEGRATHPFWYFSADYIFHSKQSQGIFFGSCTSRIVIFFNNPNQLPA